MKEQKRKCGNCEKRLTVPHRNGFPEHFCVKDGHGISHKELASGWCANWAKKVVLINCEED